MRIRRKRVSLTDEKNDQTGFFDEFVFSCNDPSPRFLDIILTARVLHFFPLTFLPSHLLTL